MTARLAPDGASVVCSVADTGIGIAAEDQERIFEEFTQLDNPVQKRVRGTGLGLPLVRKLATLLGGQRVGREHARRRLDLHGHDPLVYAGAEARRRRRARGPVWIPRASPCSSSIRGDHPRVLLIDDDEIYRYLVRTRLAEARFAVQEAAGGAEGSSAGRARSARTPSFSTSSCPR